MKDEAIIRGRWPKSVLRRGGAESLRHAAIGAAISAGYMLCGFAILLVGWAVASGVSRSLPGPFATLKVLAQLLADPFYDNGPNDKGIGIQLASSIGRVFVGFGLGSLVAIPAGVLMGASSVCRRLFNPLAQLLRPVSPLAWFPIGLAVFKHAGDATIFVIFVTSLWPTLVNTAFGVASLPDDHRNVARAFGFSRRRYLRRVLVPFALPHILTGLRLSLGIAWVVIVAGEMLSGGIGVGFFVWDSWNALSLERVMSAILLIGSIGLLLDRGFDLIAGKVSYES
ncbi:MAG TPA: nitrate ABC transporter permease [Blastocatellia bacterium]|jgi:nitrate/nitrite transport system permease protein